MIQIEDGLDEVPDRTSSGGLAVGVLGPLVVSVDGRPVVLTAGRLRTLLVVLALSAGRPVTMRRLVTALWEVDLPVDAKRSVQVYVTRLRAQFGADRIVSSPHGYTLRLAPHRVDATQFQTLVDAAGRQTDPAAQRPLLDRALALWRGNPFEDIRSTSLHQSEAPQLVDRYLSTIEHRLDLTDHTAPDDQLIPTPRDQPQKLVSATGSSSHTPDPRTSCRCGRHSGCWPRLCVAAGRPQGQRGTGMYSSVPDHRRVSARYQPRAPPECASDC